MRILSVFLTGSLSFRSYRPLKEIRNHQENHVIILKSVSYARNLTYLARETRFNMILDTVIPMFMVFCYTF